MGKDNGAEGPSFPADTKPDLVDIAGERFYKARATVDRRDKQGRPVMLRIFHDDGVVSLSTRDRSLRVYLPEDEEV